MRRTGMPLVPKIVLPQPPSRVSTVLTTIVRINADHYRVMSVNSRSVTIDITHEPKHTQHATPWSWGGRVDDMCWAIGTLEHCLNWAVEYLEKHG